jgi:chitodextrinase
MSCKTKRILAILLAYVITYAQVPPPSWAQSSVIVTLSSATAPSAGQSGITNIDVIGANFPSGTIPPSNVTITLHPAVAGPPSATATATSVTTISGSARRVFFTIPSSITVTTPTVFNVSLAGTTSTGVAFQSGNTSALTVNPPTQITAVQPNMGLAGTAVTVTVTALYSTFTQGATQVSFGPGIAVNGAAQGAFGTVKVNSPTSLTATLLIDALAAPGARTVSVQTGAQQSTLAGGFTVAGGLPVANPGGPYSANVGQVISFNGRGSTAPSGQTVTAYAWNFGDGATGTGATPSHIYTSAGTFNVSLTVTDTTGGTNVASTTATISPLPVANAGGPYTGNTNQAITFSGSSSTAPSGQTLTSFAWNFGDGSTGTGATPSHTYASSGTFTVTLTVTDTTGGTNTASTTAADSARWGHDCCTRSQLYGHES